ncbi:MliC family protein [Vibrio intestinalis]|uniref:MliC family protein n=1 Tax=Vibrio intestinalis TaxID=2933291 RepID=UPI0021A60FD8|nr:MliC family protein [Vibrio intestinalis]
MAGTMIKIGLTLLSSAFLFACSSGQSQDDMAKVNSEELYHYQCDSDLTFDVAYLIEEQGALLRIDQADFALVQVPSGSGTRYSLPQNSQSNIQPVTLYTKGEYARLELGREIYKNCKTQ